MAGVSIYGEFYSSNGSEWKWEIYDTSGSPTPEEVKCSDDCEIQWMDEGDPILEPIKSSQATFSFYNNSGAVDTFLTQLVASQEDRFHVRVYLESNLYWVGVVMPEVVTWEDMPKPTKITIRAIDGLGRLAHIKFDKVTDVGFSSTNTFLDYIIAALSYNGLDIHWGATTVYIEESCEFYDTQSPSPLSSPWPSTLKQMRCDKLMFAKTEENSTIAGGGAVVTEPLSCQDVIRVILQLLCCRITMVYGRYYIQQLRNFDGINYTYRSIYKSGTVAAVTTGGFTCRQNELGSVQRVNAVGTWGYYPPLQRVSITNVPPSLGLVETSGDLEFNQLTTESSPATKTLQLGTIRGGAGSGRQLRVVIPYENFQSALGAINPQPLYKFILHIEASFHFGTYRLKSGAVATNTLTWTTTASDVVKREFQGAEIDVDQIQEIVIVTPEIPFSIETGCYIDFNVWWTDQNGNDPSAGDAVLSSAIRNIEIYLLSNGIIANKERYEVVNPTTQNSKVIDYGEFFFSDTAQLSSKNTIEVYDGSDWQEVGVCEAGYSTDVEFTKTMALETMSLQKTPLKMFRGGITVPIGYTKGQVNPIKVWYYESTPFFFNGGTLNCNMDTMTGQWVQMLLAQTGVQVNNEYNERRGAKWPGNVLGNGEKKKKGVIDWLRKDIFAIVDDDFTVAGGAITTVTCTPISQDFIITGDVITIINPVDRRTLSTFTVDADVSITDTSITVVSKTPDNDIPAGALIVYGKYDVVYGDVVRGRIGQTTETDHTQLTRSGEFAIIGNKIYFYDGIAGNVKSVTGTT